jgi:branched-chain amino acid transport system substrate-binding protein
VLQPAGLENSVGVMAAGFLKAPGDPIWANDNDVKDYLEFMKNWNPQDNPNDSLATVAYANATMLRHVLEDCGDNLTRDNVMKQVTNIHDVRLPLHLPHVTLKTTPQDLSAFKSLQLQRFDGEKWIDVD